MSDGRSLAVARPAPRTGRGCDVEGCPRPHHARGLCAAHSERLKKYGDILADKPLGWRQILVHGTYDGYCNHGCRCSECCKAHTDYVRAANHRRGRHRPRDIVLAERRAAAEAADNHGTETRYTRGCRCDDCRRASADARRCRRAKERRR